MNLLPGIRQNPENIALWRQSILLLILAFSVTIILILLLHPYRDLARFELERTALSLAQTGVYGNPYLLPTGPTAHVSPGYTVLLAGLFHLFGTGVTAEVIKNVLASFISAIGCALIPAASIALTLSPRLGFLAGLICALLPVKPLVQIDGDWEAPYTALFITLICAVVATGWLRRDLSPRSAILRGLLWGLALLFSSVLLPAYLVVLMAGLLIFRQGFLRPYVTAAAVEVLLVGLCLTPWIVRNQRALHSPIATRSNSGLELRVSNNDEATADQRVNYTLGVYDHFHPLQNREEALKVRQLGEVAYNRLALTGARQWISTHPRRFVQLTLGRFWDFWFYPDPSRAKAGFGYLTGILGWVGLIFLWRKRWEAGLLATIILLFYSAPSYLIQVGARQRYPVDWLLTLLSVLALERAWAAWTRARSRSTKPPLLPLPS